MTATDRAPAPAVPNIVVADAYTTAPDLAAWSELSQLGSLRVFDRCGPERLLDRCRGAQIVLTNKERFDAETLAALPELRFISVLATGTNVIDLEAAARRGIVVSNVPAYATEAVAQHVMCLLLALNNHLLAHDRAARDGSWAKGPDFNLLVHPIAELQGQCVGIVGYGAIGRQVEKLAKAFGMRVITAQRAGSDSATQRDTYAAPRPGPSKQEPPRVPLDQLFTEADVVTLHCPLTEATRELVNATRLARMKPSALLINTGRGGLVDSLALRQALDRKQLRGAAVDVLEMEPPAEDHPLLDAPNCIVTPHIAWASTEARGRLIEQSVANVRAFLRGAPANVVA